MENKILQERAKQLRSNMTDVEKILWQYLRAKRFSKTKFRRQQVLGNYIVDFVCFSSKVIIELDGSQHFEHQEYDEERTRFLNLQGFKVLRFWNNEVYASLESVLDSIFYAVENPSL